MKMYLQCKKEKTFTTTIVIISFRYYLFFPLLSQQLFIGKNLI